MRNTQHQSHAFIHTHFMGMLKLNKKNVLHIAHENEFIIIDNPVIDFGGVSQEATNVFSNNFMRKSHESHSDCMTNESDLCYSFKNINANSTRDEAIESFSLGSIYILMFTSRCPSLADPTLHATVFNYSENTQFEFYEKNPNLCTFLNTLEILKMMTSST